jgi:hypothetical protein
MDEWVKTIIIYLIKIGISILVVVLAKYIAKLIYKIILSTAEKSGKVAISYKKIAYDFDKYCNVYISRIYNNLCNIH